MSKDLVLSKAFSALATIDEVKMAIANVTNVTTVADLRKRVEAARKYDSQTSERRNYWGELAIWSERRIGELLIEAKSDGGVKQGRPELKGSIVEPLLLADLLGTETDSQAKHISSRSQRLASYSQESIEEAIDAVKTSGEEVSKAAVNRKLVGPHVGHNSVENEWYTPPEYIEAARSAMGGIDLDPATSEKAQQTVKAKKFYTADDDGLSKAWKGRVWLNPPYSKDLIGKFCDKLAESVEGGKVTAAILLVNNATDTAWFHRVAGKASAVCFVKGRIAFHDSNGEPKGKPLQGQMAMYFGGYPQVFAKEFGGLGECFFGGWQSGGFQALRGIIDALDEGEAAVVRDWITERLN